MEFDAVADFAAEELLAERGLGGDHQDLRSLEVNLQAAAFRAEKVEGACAPGFEFHQSGEVDGRGFLKFPKFERLVDSEGLFGFGGEAGLRTGEVSGFQPARIVLVLGLVLFVGGVGMHGAGSSRERGQLLGELSDDLSDNHAF